MRKVTIFCSYARIDLERVLPIVKALESSGHRPWLDVEQLLPGQPWLETIEKAIEEATFFLAFLSRASVDKAGVVQKELRLALQILDLQPEGRLYLIPARLDDCRMPSRFAGLQRCDLFEDHALDRLEAAICEGLRQRGWSYFGARIVGGPGEGMPFKIFGNVATLGRASSNSIALPDKRVSSVHGKIELRRGQAVYTHLAEGTATVVEHSRGVIKLTSSRETRFSLSHHDILKLGDTELVIELSSEIVPEMITTTEV